MSKTYDLRFRGKTYNGISLAEVKQILSEVYSYAYIDDLLRKANGDYSPLEIEWIPAKRKNWRVNGMRMGREGALFACEFKGCSKAEAEFLLRANKLCADVAATVQESRQVCRRIDEEAALYRESLRKRLRKSHVG